MDKRTLERFRKALKEQRDALHLRLATARQQSHSSILAESKDEGDRATASIATEMSAIERTQAENLLKSVNHALDQIDAGTYGQCRNCEQEIGAKRLEAIPWARYCITCQELIDSK